MAGLQHNFNTDIKAAEEKLLSVAKESIKEYKAILSELAFRYAGKLIEEERRTDPNAPGNWDSNKWKLFWEKSKANVVVPPTPAPVPAPLSTKKVNTWAEEINSGLLKSDNSVDVEQIIQKLQNAEDDLAATKQELEVAQNETRLIQDAHDQLLVSYRDGHVQINNLKKLLKNATDELTNIKAASRNAHNATINKSPDQSSNGGKRNTEESTSSQPVAPPPLFMEQMAKEAAEACKEEKKPPLKYEGRTLYNKVDGNVRYKRQLMILYLMGKYGLSIRMEIERIVTITEMTSPQSKTLKKAIDNLVETNMLESLSLSLEEPFHTNSVIVRLTEDGKEFCRLFDWDVVESEWDRLEKYTNGERGHMLATFLLTMNARVRGWETKVVADLNGLTVDNVIFKSGQLHYSTYINGHVDLEKLQKIQELSPDKRVSIFTYDAENCKSAIELCKQKKLRGVGTDLKNLIFDQNGNGRFYTGITQQDPLWLTEWEYDEVKQ